MKYFKPIFYLLFLSVGLLPVAATAQAPNLPKKDALANSILTGKTFNGTALDTVVRPYTAAGDYTLQVSAKVNSATGRGLDIEARSALLKGFRLSLDASMLKWSSHLATIQGLSDNATGDQVIRIAVKNDTAHIYQNGAYLLSKPVADVKDIVGGIESDEKLNVTYGANLIPGWAGTTGNNGGKPSDYGWDVPYNAIFNTANAGSGVRYLDINGSSGSTRHTYNGSAYVGRIMYMRWDNASLTGNAYSYPVTLEANTTYTFSMLLGYVSNASGGKTVTAGIGKTISAGDRFASQTFTAIGTQDFGLNSFTFTTTDAGTYYLTFTGDWALFSVADLGVKKLEALPRFIFGKNYTDGAVDMQITAATYEAGAYAPQTTTTGTRQPVTLTGDVVHLLPTLNTDFTVPGKTDVHLTGDGAPFINSTFALTSADAWLFFDNVKPSVVISNWLDKVTVNGIAAAINPNVRVAIYKNGTVIIPNGNQTSKAALQVFKQPNLAGDTKTYEIEVYNNGLGEFDNRVRSFKLKRGYMATFATNADGSGYSRVFIANDSDLIVNAMPAGLDTTASFVRVFKWNWVSKKGKAGWDPSKINATWYYDWNIAGNTAADYEYAAIRQTAYWPGWGDINNKSNISHVLGFNEPDRPDQANMTVDQAIAVWPEIMKSGLRIGSPAPASPPGWLIDFMTKAEALNYRVDYIAIHCYWGGLTPQQWYTQLKAIYDRFKRPIWITEWNNGANWTTETWPADPNAQFQKQLTDLKGILNVLDTSSFIERYALYDWVENKRALVLADTLTPAGKYYAASKSDFAFDPQMEYIHTWKLAAPALTSTINNDNYTKTTISWPDLNGELGLKYVLERMIDGSDAGFVTAQEFTGYTDGSVLSFSDDVRTKTTYRLKIYALDCTTFIYSTTLEVNGDAAAVAPTSLTGDIISSSKIKLYWNAGANARSYTLKRSLKAAGPFDAVAARTTALEYLDEGLQPATTYYYVVTSLNTMGESNNSAVLSKTTPALVMPGNVVSPRAASGDGEAILTWDFMYDADYYILRSATSDGPFDTIARNVDTLRYEDLARENSKTYYYKIVAHNAIGFGPATAVLAATPFEGQHVYVSFDDNSSAVAEDVWGGYHADLQATATRDAGHLSNALKLDGTADAYAALRPGVVSKISHFTMSLWVNMESLTNWMRIFDFGKGTNNYMFLSAQSSVANGVSVLRYAIKNGGAEQTLSYNYTWPLSTWVHLVLTQSDSEVKMYVNGTPVASTTAITIKPSDLGTTTLNYIGKSQFSADPMLKGMVDEFKIYNNVLSDENIQNLYNGTTLPVKLVSFSGSKTSGGNLLAWATSQEANSDYFVLERASGTAANFSAIAKINSKGNSSQPTAYSYLDATAKTGTYYYRLKQVDKDGRAVYSNVIIISTAAQSRVKVYPNPLGNLLTIELPATSNAKTVVRIMNTEGRIMFEQTFAGASNLLQIKPGKMAAGMYQVQVVTGATTYNVPVIKE